MGGSNLSNRRTGGPQALAAEGREFVAEVVDKVSNALQVILGYSQILHELDDDERPAAIEAIRVQSERLRVILAELTTASRTDAGEVPWNRQETVR
jgi:signal transduction histidine kinase